MTTHLHIFQHDRSAVHTPVVRWVRPPVMALLVCVVLGGASAGCAGPTAPILTQPGPEYEGPELIAETADGQWVIVTIAPSGGWTLHLDRVLDRPITKQVFVTLERPDPGVAYAQALVPVRRRTMISSLHPLRVHARVAPFAGAGVDEEALPYRMVEQFRPR